jgi:hypothetical protein
MKESESPLSSSVEVGVGKNHKWSLFKVCHREVSVGYGMKFRIITEMKTNLNVANPWLERNNGLFEEVSNVLRMVDPDQYLHS